MPRVSHFVRNGAGLTPSPMGLAYFVLDFPFSKVFGRVDGSFDFRWLYGGRKGISEVVGRVAGNFEGEWKGGREFRWL